MMRIPVAGPSITTKEIDYVTDAVTNAWYGNADAYNKKFEVAFATHCQRRFAVTTPSCTSALHLALLALGVGPGDEVIVPDVTWIASVAPVNYVGATPVFVDMDEQSWCVSTASFTAAITPRTKAAIVVDLYGSMPDLTELERITKQAGIQLIEDAAEAIGSKWQNRPAGNFGVVSTFSFHGSKTLTTGEGGMLVLDDAILLDRVQRLRDHGRVPGDAMFLNEEVGWKYKMSSMQAALGLAQLERVDELVSGKRQIFSWYKKYLGNWNAVKLNPDVTGLFNSYWMTTAIIDPNLGVTKKALFDELRATGVDVRPFFSPLTSIPAYYRTPEAAVARSRNPVGPRITPFGINLPSALALTESDVSEVCGALRRAVEKLVQIKTKTP
jgi:perosamine synthetase